MCQLERADWWIPRSRFIEPKEIVPKIDYFPVRLCNKCNKVWEKPLRHTRFLKIVYHEDFPTYGLTREVCNECIKK